MKKYVCSQIRRRVTSTAFIGAVSGPLILSTVVPTANATEPCGDFGECKVLVEINSSDGDIGFHWLVDGDGQRSTRIDDPTGRKIWEDNTSGALRKQLKTENSGESSEPLCFVPPPEDQDEDFDPEDVVTLRDFRDRWDPGTYGISGKGAGGEKLSGTTELTYYLPAAPQDVDFDGSIISWAAGDDLGNCASLAEIPQLVLDGVLAAAPADVAVIAWEIVLEPDVEDGDPLGALKFTVRVPGDIAPKAVTVSADYLASLPSNTPVKIEVGAIGGDFEIVDGEDGVVVEGDDDNATFTEEDGFCVNDTGPVGCED